MLEVAIQSLDVALNPHAVLSGMEENKDSFERIEGAHEVNADHGSLE